MTGIPTPPADRYKDRRGLLITCGVIQILLAALLAINIPLMVLSVVLASRIPSGPVLTWRYVAYSIFLYAALSAFFFVVGIGSLRCRRWARSLMLVVSWTWLVGGTVAFIISLLTVPRAMHTAMTRGGQQVPSGFVEVLLVVTFLILAVMYVVLPMGFLLVYRSNNVRLTAEFRDPQIRWTDRVRARVLGAVVAGLFSAFCCLAAALFVPFFPGFGTLLTGWPAAAALVLIAALFLGIAIGLYRLDMKAWWATVGVMLLLSLANLLTWAKVPLLRLYELMGMTGEQLDILRGNPILAPEFLILSSAAFTIFILCYLVWIRRDFMPSSPPAAT